MSRVGQGYGGRPLTRRPSTGSPFPLFPPVKLLSGRARAIPGRMSGKINRRQQRERRGSANGDYYGGGGTTTTALFPLFPPVKLLPYRVRPIPGRRTESSPRRGAKGAKSDFIFVPLVPFRGFPALAGSFACREEIYRRQQRKRRRPVNLNFSPATGRHYAP